MLMQIKAERSRSNIISEIELFREYKISLYGESISQKKMLFLLPL